MKTVCFTGHRFFHGVDISKLIAILDRAIAHKIREGATVFRTGGALGFDTLAAQRVLEARKVYPEIRLELLLPCPQQTDRWNPRDVEIYEQIKRQADSFTHLSSTYSPGVMHARNRALVDGSDACIAFWCRKEGGGTAYTVVYAMQRNIPVINLFPLL